MEKFSSIRLSYISLLTTESPISSILVAIEKKFFKIETQFKKCRQFCKSLLAQFDPASLSRTHFALAPPTLIYLLDENVYALYSSIFLAKKIQTLQTLIDIILEYHTYFFFSSSDTSSSHFEFNIESFFLPFK